MMQFLNTKDHIYCHLTRGMYLRHQLEELLSQGIIAPVNEKEHIPISSPIVLASKRNRPNSGLKTGSKEESLSLYRFCVDFRYLNSNTHDFRYAIPNVDELTESFTQRIPNFISSFDLSSGFFKCTFRPSLPSIQPSILVLVHLSLIGYLYGFENITKQFSASYG